METKRAKVVMLPAKDNGAVSINKHGKYFIGSYKDCNQNHLCITTDEEIKEGDYWIYVCPINGVDYGDDNNPITKNNLPSSWFEKLHDRKNYHKIIATTDKSLKGVAQLHQSFIEKYCKEGGIDEVLVEYEGYKVNGMRDEATNYRPKIDSHNTITIHPIKDSWSREELLPKLIELFMENTSTPSHISEESAKQYANNWIKNNL